MVRVWRIVTARFADTAFSGEGARRYGGRWNRKGVPLVYTAGSQSLAMLEILVQDEPLRARYMMIPAEIPADLPVVRMGPEQLPDDWRDPAALETLRSLGAHWVAGMTSAVLAVPSAVVPAETNYLLNPRHPDFARIEIGEPEVLVTDLRLRKIKVPEPVGGDRNQAPARVCLQAGPGA
jgi:RES domain-containing protein